MGGQAGGCWRCERLCSYSVGRPLPHRVSSGALGAQRGQARTNSQKRIQPWVDSQIPSVSQRQGWTSIPTEVRCDRR